MYFFFKVIHIGAEPILKSDSNYCPHVISRFFKKYFKCKTKSSLVSIKKSWNHTWIKTKMRLQTKICPNLLSGDNLTMCIALVDMTFRFCVEGSSYWKKCLITTSLVLKLNAICNRNFKRSFFSLYFFRGENLCSFVSLVSF